MATVRFSDELRNNIRNNARQIFRGKEARLVPDNWTAKFQPVVDHYCTTMERYQSNLPSEFLKHSEELHVDCVFIGDEKYAAHAGTISGGKFVSPILAISEGPLLAELGFVRLDSGYRTVNVRLDGACERWESLTKEVVALAQKSKVLEDEKVAFVEGVDRVVSAYSTLAPALKAWPPLWDLLPEDKKERHKLIVERKKVVNFDEELGVDLNSMTTISAMAKLTGSN